MKKYKALEELINNKEILDILFPIGSIHQQYILPFENRIIPLNEAELYADELLAILNSNSKVQWCYFSNFKVDNMGYSYYQRIK